jgi:hypothetical protein
MGGWIKVVACLWVVLVGATGCASEVMTHTVTIDERFDEEQRAIIVDALDQWKLALPGTYVASHVFGKTTCNQPYAIHFVEEMEHCNSVGDIIDGRSPLGHADENHARITIRGELTDMVLLQTVIHEQGHTFGASHTTRHVDVMNATDSHDTCIAENTLDGICDEYGCDAPSVPSCSE